MAECSYASECFVNSFDDEEERKELYPNTVELKDTAVKNYDAKNEKMTNKKEEEEDYQMEAKSDQAQKLQTDTQAEHDDRKIDSCPKHVPDVAISNQRVYKKSLLNNKLTLYLGCRDILVSEAKTDNKILGVVLIDPDYVGKKKVYCQIVLTFRYGREDEEVMGLKFYNEALMSMVQLYPPVKGAYHMGIKNSLQEALVKRLGPNAYAFTMNISSLCPPSVQLLPAKTYNGPPIGNIYDIKVYTADRPDERPPRKATIRMGIRVIQRPTKPPLPSTTLYSVPSSQEPSTSSKIQGSKTRALAENEIIEADENVGPYMAVEKPFLLSDGRVRLEAGLDHAVYEHGDSINVHVNIINKSSRSVKRMKVFVVQHVEVCIFNNGAFKNVVALISSQKDCPLGPGSNLRKTYTLRPVKGTMNNWIALENNYTKTGSSLASTIVNPKNAPEDRNIYTIYVSYYVKVKLFISVMGGEISLKLPFTLMHSNMDADLMGLPSPVRETPKKFENSTNEITEQSDSSNHRNKETKLEANKESRMTDMDLIEHCEESDST